MKIMKIMKNYKKFKISIFEIFTLIKKSNSKMIVTLFGKKLKINSFFWYLHGLEEIFIDEIYRFNSLTETPRIIDCGANIGLSIIYFKKLFPKSKITAFEPDLEIFEILEQNISTFRHGDVEIINKAIWNKNGYISFLASGGVSGRIKASSTSGGVSEVQTFRLKDMLDEKIDFLKIDIEGAEFEVIKDCASKLSNVKNLFIEYHSLEENEQSLDEILKIIKDSGFKYYIKEAWNNQPMPYVNKRTNLFDLQLNIFGYRLEK